MSFAQQSLHGALKAVLFLLGGCLTLEGVLKIA